MLELASKKSRLLVIALVWQWHQFDIYWHQYRFRILWLGKRSISSSATNHLILGKHILIIIHQTHKGVNMFGGSWPGNISNNLNLLWAGFYASRSQEESQVISSLCSPFTFQGINSEWIPLQPEENLVNFDRMICVWGKGKDTNVVNEAFHMGEIWKERMHYRLKEIRTVGYTHWQPFVFV